MQYMLLGTADRPLLFTPKDAEEEVFEDCLLYTSEPYKGTPKHKKPKHGKHDVPMAFPKRQKTIPIASSCGEAPPGIQ